MNLTGAPLYLDCGAGYDIEIGEEEPCRPPDSIAAIFSMISVIAGKGTGHAEIGRFIEPEPVGLAEPVINIMPDYHTATDLLDIEPQSRRVIEERTSGTALPESPG